MLTDLEIIDRIQRLLVEFGNTLGPRAREVYIVTLKALKEKHGL